MNTKFKKNYNVILPLIFSSSVHAGIATNNLSNCLADNTSGKDRKVLIQWIFGIMSTHPEIKQFSKITDIERENFDKKVATLATRLLTEDCINEAKEAIKTDGTKSFSAAFGSLGRLAMTEVMTNPEVNQSVCSGQVKLATVLSFSQYSRSDSLGVKPPLY